MLHAPFVFARVGMVQKSEPLNPVAGRVERLSSSYSRAVITWSGFA
jgi:hypothetical protein